MSAEWVALVPTKASSRAKTRLGLAQADRTRLAQAFASDLVTALLTTSGITEVAVIMAHEVTWPPPAGTRRLPDAGRGLNAALASAAATYAARLGPHVGVLGIVADLPCARPQDLACLLSAASRTLDTPEGPSATFLADVSGVGTTALLAPARTFAPEFGRRSAAHHRAAGAAPIGEPLPRLRRDVDAMVDLRDARRLGVGPATHSVLESLGLND